MHPLLAVIHPRFLRRERNSFTKDGKSCMGTEGCAVGFFGAKERRVPYHPRKEPRIDRPITAENIKAVFADCTDFQYRTVLVAGDPSKVLDLFVINGMVRMERLSDYVLRPLAQDESLGKLGMQALFDRLAGGAAYNLGVQIRDTMDQVAFDLVAGYAVFLFPGLPKALSFFVGTEEKRSISRPENEPVVKGSADSFVENLRTNTSLVRRHIRAPELRIREQLVGRQSVTPVDLLWIDGLTDPALVEEAWKRLENIDIDALLTTGNLEEYLVDEVNTPFPMLGITERPDRFCQGLMEGRVGILLEGIPQGYLAPGTIGQFFATEQDRSSNWMVASCILVLRYLCVLITLFLPGAYIAAVNFHPEMIPVKLALSINAAKAGVPFPTVFEVLIMLLAFEIVQEAGLRLPSPIGQTVSILGGLVVGTAAVEAKIVSPAVLIVVAVAGIAGYTVPNQDLAGALRLWRFLISVAASVGGAGGLVLGGMALVCQLARLESFGVAYLTPFAANAGEQVEGHAVIRLPLSKTKLRPYALKTRNRRNQK